MRIIDLTNEEQLFSEIDQKYLPQGGVFLFGFFDGVHLGHRELFKKALEISRSQIPVIVWTFEHLTTKSSAGYLTSTEEKFRLFREYGANYIISEDFEELRAVDGRTFFFSRIMREFSPRSIICGFNFRFGKDAACDSDDLAVFASESGIPCYVVPPLVISGMPVSSSSIRNAVSYGDLTTAEKLLGRPYTITSNIVHGKHIGRLIGHPTINQRLPDGKLPPKFGVYSCIVALIEADEKNKTVFGVCNIGSRPTVNNDTSDITLETYLFDFSGDLYGMTVRTSLIEFLREECRFSSLEELNKQIDRDELAARKSLRMYDNEHT